MTTNYEKNNLLLQIYLDFSTTSATGDKKISRIVPRCDSCQDKLNSKGQRDPRLSPRLWENSSHKSGKTVNYFYAPSATSRKRRKPTRSSKTDENLWETARARHKKDLNSLFLSAPASTATAFIARE